jgi:hypothetical protein
MIADIRKALVFALCHSRASEALERAQAQVTTRRKPRWRPVDGEFSSGRNPLIS